MGLFDKLKGKLTDAVGDKLSDLGITEEENNQEEITQELEDDRPEGVPANAVWNDDNDEWELGEKDDNGANVGEWKWWREDGTLCCKTNFEAGSMGRNFSFERYHEDGTYSQKGNYVNGVQHGTFYYQGSTNETTERVMDQAPAASIFRFEFDWNNGSVQATRQWDIDGNELTQKGTPINLKKPESVDENAVFNEEYQEYQLETYNEFGQAVGTHKYWRLNGAIFEEIAYENGIKSAHRKFHPSGNLAMEYLYQSGCMRFTSRVQIDEAGSDIEFNRGGLADEVVKKEYVFDELGFMTAWKGFDAQGTCVVEEAINLSMNGAIEQINFDSVDAASAHWNEQGEAFFQGMNHYVDQYYVEGHPQVDYEPQDERGNMEKYMIHQIVKMNQTGEQNRLNEQFTPSINAFSKEFWMSSGRKIVSAVPDNSTVYVNLENEAYEMSENSSKRVEGARFVGISTSKNCLIICKENEIEVKDLQSKETKFTVNYPTTYDGNVTSAAPNISTQALTNKEHLGILGVDTCYADSAVILSTKRGTFVIDTDKSACIFPSAAVLTNEIGDQSQVLTLVNNYSSISSDGNYLNCTAAFDGGAEYTAIFKLNLELKTAELLRTDREDHMFITKSMFDAQNNLIQGRYQQPDGYGRGDTTFLLAIPENQYNSVGDGIVNDQTPSYYNFMGEVQGSINWENKLLSATGKKYFWTNFAPGSEGGLQYTFLGGDLHYGNIASVSVSPNGNSLVVATDYGCVFTFKPTENSTLRKHFVSNMNLDSDKMFLFIHGNEPLIW